MLSLELFPATGHAAAWTPKFEKPSVLKINVFVQRLDRLSLFCDFDASGIGYSFVTWPQG